MVNNSPAQAKDENKSMQSHKKKCEIWKIQMK